MAEAGKKYCIKCKIEQDLSQFGADGSGGKQSYCRTCKAKIAKNRIKRNVPARLKHHISTRVKDQLGDKCPSDMTLKLHKYLGYSMGALSKALKADLKEREGPDASLRKALADGAHVDHIKPLRLFKVIRDDGEIDWEEFRACWAISNQRVLSKEENLKKGSRYEEG